MPALTAWLQHADAAYKFVAAEFAHLPKHMQMERLIEANVLLQIEGLATIPAVAKALARDELDIYGWVYRIENGEVRTFNLDSATFEPITDAPINAPRGVPTLQPRVSAETCDTDIESVR
jgi:carbonic anhydrase